MGDGRQAAGAGSLGPAQVGGELLGELLDIGGEAPVERGFAE